MREHTAEELNKYIDHFTEIYPEDESKDENPMPDGVKLTVYCNGNGEVGFAENVTTLELGIEAFIAKKWILQSELDELMNTTLL